MFVEFTFINIEKDNVSETYSYTYIITIKIFVMKIYYKILFKSKLPHYVFTDILHVLKIKFKPDNKSIEDIIESNEQIDLGIGQFYIKPFTYNDKINFTTNKKKWKIFLNKALLKQNNYEKEYNNIHCGYPKLNLPLREMYE